MECSEAQRRILESSVDAEVEAHLRDCDACRELAEDDARLARTLSALRDEEPASADGFDELLGSIRAEDESFFGKLRSMSTARRAAIAFAAVLVGGVIFTLTGLRPDWDIYPMFRMFMVLSAMILAAGFGVVLALPKVYRPERPLGFRIALFLFLLAIPFIPALLPIAHEAHAAPGQGFLAGAGACLGVGLLASLPALLVMRALQRDDDWEMWSTLFAALAAAAGGNIALQLHCPAVDPMHILAGHAILGVVYAVLAWLVVRVVVRSS